MTALLTLITDFGTASPYVAAMKGVILGINPAARLIDISHDIPPQDIRHGAVILAEATTWFPAGTIHVAVVDPGVGTERRLIYARIGDQQYLAPDNGLLSLLVTRDRPTRIVELANSEHWLPEVSHTFHGRDILAPVAAQLSLGLEPERLGPALQEIEMLDWPSASQIGNRINGAVVWIDHFGNLITNIGAGMLPAKENLATTVTRCGDKVIVGISRTYGERKAGERSALIGSSGFLEISVVNGNAAHSLAADAGTPVVVEF